LGCARGCGCCAIEKGDLEGLLVVGEEGCLVG
jgi:hypothetical protein